MHRAKTYGLLINIHWMFFFGWEKALPSIYYFICMIISLIAWLVKENTRNQSEITTYTTKVTGIISTIKLLNIQKNS